MTQEDKELLLKDLCSRLPYGVKVNITSKETKNRIVHLTADNICNLTSGWWSECKPYLFPLSSMTEEQSKIYHELIHGMFGTSALINFEALEEFFHKNHIDYRGLIPMGLAIDATDLNIY